MKDKIKQILRENTNEVTKISIFDFDGTLVDTGTPETHKDIWKEKTGTPYPHKGWWGRKESLDTTVFDFEPNKPVIDAYNSEKNISGNLMVMLTGRLPKLSNEVEAILSDNGLSFDHYMYNYGGSTLDNKIKQMGELLANNPDVKSISQYEDRVDHIPTFKAWGDGLVKSGRLEEFNLYHFDGTNLKKL
jgi:hypothetical protein